MSHSTKNHAMTKRAKSSIKNCNAKVSIIYFESQSKTAVFVVGICRTIVFPVLSRTSETRSSETV
jgi:hypothetical protein